MEKLEKNIMYFWKELLKKTTITISDFEELEGVMLNSFNKIQRQRERLEKSRDMWKSKYLELKSKK